VGIYPTNGPEACQYISEHSEAEVVVVENGKQLEKFISISSQLPQLKALVMWEGSIDDDVIKAASSCPIIYTWEDFMKLGQDVPDADIQSKIDGKQAKHRAPPHQLGAPSFIAC